MATTSHVRRINERKIIQAMMRLRTASRSELARAADLSQPTVGRIVDEMLEHALLAEGDSDAENGSGKTATATVEKAQLGRPSRPLELDRRRRRFVAIQIGVKQTRLAALPMAVSDADEWAIQFPTPASPAAFQEALAEHWKQLGVRNLDAVVISLPGVVDERAGRVLLSPNVHWTEGADFHAIVRAVSRAPIAFVQEIRALALGQLAAEPNVRDFLLVDFGSGVGAAAVIRGKLYDAPIPLSGEVGHTPVLGNDRPCSCGAVGCLETLVSRKGILATARQQGGIRDWAALQESITRDGVPAWLTPSLDALADTIAGALNLLGLRQVILTGALNELPTAAQYVCDATQRGAMWSRFGDVSCRLAPRRRMAGMVTVAVDEILFVDGAAGRRGR
jgi:predicted NBD/HSP70 family sugar kinase